MVVELYTGTASQELTIQVLETISSSLSFVGCTTTLYFLYKNKSSALTNTLLSYLMIIDLISCIFYGIGVAGTYSPGFCQLQGLIVQWFGLAGILWVTYMSYQMYCWVVLKYRPEKTVKYVLLHFTLIMIATGILGLVLLGENQYAYASVWCWIAPQNTAVRFFCFYLILIVAWVFTIVVLNAVSISLRRQIRNNDSIRTNIFSSERKIKSKLAKYILVFVITWFFPLLNRLTGVFSSNPYYVTTALQAAILPLRGFLNAAVYGNVLVAIYNLFVVKLVLNMVNIPHKTRDVTLYNIDECAENSITVPNYSSKDISIFTTTLNFGEAPFEDVLRNIDSWILKGHDMYVIGFQECLAIVELRQLILDYLGKPGEYVGFGNEIGSGNTKLGYHGYIGLFAFVRAKDLSSGDVIPIHAAVDTMATGANLIVAKAQNKGAAGLAFQVNDTSIAFISCHLPSDSKGKSKLSKRNASAHSVLKQMNLSPEAIGFDAHFQQDHLILLGDLNYRVDVEGVGGSKNLLNLVSEACLMEKNSIIESSSSPSSWLQKKYDMLRYHEDGRYPSEFELKLLLNAKSLSRNAWLDVLVGDELRLIMEGGDAFYGFFEPLPCFPPSYKRRKHILGDCGDYTDLSDLLRGFSNIGQDHLVNKLDKVQINPASEKIMSSTLGSRKQERPFSLKLKSLSFSSTPKIQRNDTPEASDETTVREISADSNHSSSSDVATELVDLNSVEEGKSSSVKVDSSPSSKSRQVRRIALTNESSINISSTKANDISKEDRKKSRPPSYTDRILVYSLRDRRKRMKIQAYDLCDMMRVSDHRPVCMAIRLEVNKNVKYSDSSSGDYSGQLLGVSTGMFELSILNLVVKLGDNFIDNAACACEERNPTEEDDDDLDLEDTMHSGDQDALSTSQRNMDESDSQSMKELSGSEIKEAGEDSDSASVSTQSDIEDALFERPESIRVIADNAWKKKVEENQRMRMQKKQDEACAITAMSYSVKKNLSKKMRQHLIKDSKIDKFVASVTAVFPLPSKDPLLSLRTIHNFAEALEANSSDLFSSYKEIADKCIQAKPVIIRIDQTQSPMSSAAINEIETLNTRPAPLIAADAFMRPSSTFPWKERYENVTKESLQSIGQKTVDMKMTGLVSKELGAHVLLKISNKAGFDLGECVVSLSHMITMDPSRIMRTEIKKIPLSSGGQFTGEASATFMLRYLPGNEESFPTDSDEIIPSQVNPMHFG